MGPTHPTAKRTRPKIRRGAKPPRRQPTSAVASDECADKRLPNSAGKQRDIDGHEQLVGLQRGRVHPEQELIERHLPRAVGTMRFGHIRVMNQKHGGWIGVRVVEAKIAADEFLGRAREYLRLEIRRARGAAAFRGWLDRFPAAGALPKRRSSRCRSRGESHSILRSV